MKSSITLDWSYIRVRAEQPELHQSCIRVASEIMDFRVWVQEGNWVIEQDHDNRVLSHKICTMKSK